MDLKEKIVAALSSSLPVQYIRLEEDGDISGFVISPQFNGMTSLERQRVIDEALTRASPPITAKERRRVLMIAGLTPL